jgi:hypothetical protein
VDEDGVLIARWGAVSREIADAFFGATRELGPAEKGEPRAVALYDALGATKRDTRFRLLELGDGRWALVGRTVEGEPFAVEGTPPKSVNPWRLR